MVFMQNRTIEEDGVSYAVVYEGQSDTGHLVSYTSYMSKEDGSVARILLSNLMLTVGSEEADFEAFKAESKKVVDAMVTAGLVVV